MEGKIWDFGDTFNTYDSPSVYSTGKSRDLLVKFSDVSIIKHNPSKRNIDDQLKTIREENHKGYFHNANLCL